MHHDIKIQGLILDMDGVFYIGDQLIAGASDTLRFLHEQNFPVKFITNTTTRTPDELITKLMTLGLKARSEDIFTAVQATERYLAMRGTPSVFLLVTENVKSCFTRFPEDDENPDFVIIGDIGASWNYDTLNRVFNMLMRGSRLICMHRNKYWQAEDGLRMDIGAFVAALEYVSGTHAIVIGKPAPAFFQMTLAALQLPAEHVAIIGDDIDVDIGGGQAIGLQGILVQTGKYREQLAQRSAVRPDHIISSIASLPELVRHLNW